MKFFLLTFNTILILLTGCSAIPTTRYEQNPKSENSKEEVKQFDKTPSKIFLKEDYDVGRFSPNLETKEEVSKENTVSETKVWYSFPEEDVDNDLTITSKIIGSADGFRVSVYSTDDLEEIKEVQLRLEEVKGINQVYSVFEPPFYKLYIGDFSIVEDAISLKNKLNQLGFKEAKVIRTTISLFEK